MAQSSKTENGIRYTIQRRRDASFAESSIYWQSADGTILELTDEEMSARDTSRSITDA